MLVCKEGYIELFTRHYLCTQYLISCNIFAFCILFEIGICTYVRMSVL